MGLMASVVQRKGKREEMGEVVPVPVLRTNRQNGTSTDDDLAAFEGVYRESANSCEVALARGILPNPEKPKEKKIVDALMKEYAEKRITEAELTMGRFEPFAEADKEGFDAYVAKLNLKYKAREREDMKKRPLTTVSFA